ncbi:hypothetical protein B0H10DRAFT_1967915 [Mycena sp. CBHHK59/15]|nr:hypothetical protein B0H10DRAFT_1967915 [Mycena sp. CBHHK59/15]
MPRLSSRQARTRHIIDMYLRHRKTHTKCQIRQKTKLARALRRAGFTAEDQELPQAATHDLWGDLDHSESSSGSSVGSHSVSLGAVRWRAGIDSEVDSERVPPPEEEQRFSFDSSKLDS